MNKHIKNLWRCLAAALLLGVWAAQPAAAFDTSLDDELLLLVNGTYQLDKNYKPTDLENTSRQAKSTKSRLMLRKTAAAAYYDMIQAYKTQSRRTIYSISGYRDFAYQERLFNTKLAGRQSMGQSYNTAYKNTLEYTALPGTSEHQTGLAVDLSSNNALSDNFRNTVQGKWLLKNCWDYGFILRYDENKRELTNIAYEPWHYRYVGLPHSLIIRDNSWVLEEYIDYLHQNGLIEYTDPANPDMLWRVYWTNDTTAEFAGITNVSRDNTGGYIITTQNPRPDVLLTAWVKEALSADGIMHYI